MIYLIIILTLTFRLSETFKQEFNMQIIRTSPFSGNTNVMEIDVTLEQLSSWQVDGVLIQDAMPHLTPDEREFIKTGITPEEWDSAFN